MKFGNVIVYIDKFFPSSQICSKCGEIHSEMKDVTKRTLECKCGNIIDRDYNSAINLLKFDETVVYNKSYQTLGRDSSIKIRAFFVSSIKKELLKLLLLYCKFKSFYRLGIPILKLKIGHQ